MLISNFNSLFEVSIALHLAYALIRDVNEYHIRRIEDITDSASKFAESPSDGKHDQRLNFAIRLIRTAISDRRRLIEASTLRKQKFCVWIAALSTAILIFAGVKPDKELGGYVVFGVLGLVLLPMPLCCLHSYVSHRWWREGIEEKIDDLFSAWSGAIGLSENIYKPK